ncbi:hypothetical protein Unana1_05057 [Umbelopsis nana]
MDRYPQTRVFSPIILFHEDTVWFENDHYRQSILQPHKERVSHMLECNERFWRDIKQTNQAAESETSSSSHSPSPSTSDDLADIQSHKRRRGNLPKPVIILLRTWLINNKRHPYPSEEVKRHLARQTGLTKSQISNWFINARRRILKEMIDVNQDGNPLAKGRRLPRGKRSDDQDED